MRSIINKDLWACCRSSYASPSHDTNSTVFHSFVVWILWYGLLLFTLANLFHVYLSVHQWFYSRLKTFFQFIYIYFWLLSNSLCTCFFFLHVLKPSRRSRPRDGGQKLLQPTTSPAVSLATVPQLKLTKIDRRSSWSSSSVRPLCGNG